MTHPSDNPTDEDTRSIKCVVWDLDDTLWHGILLEDGAVSLRGHVPEVIRTLDSRGILQSIASRNDHDSAWEKLGEFGLRDYFLYPQIGWGAKSDSIRTIAESLNIGLDSVALIDDQQFEREEVSFALPEVLCIAADELDRVLELPEMNPRFITDDSVQRREMVMNDIARKQAEESFGRSQEEFLATLGMRLRIFPAEEEDLQRAEELTVRTNQLNATGYTYAYDELDRFRQSPQHKLLMAKLDDCFGTYGTIGLALVECAPDVWVIKLLLMSCRVMARGIGSIMLSHIMRTAHDAGVQLHAEFVPTPRNRMMEITYRFAGFREIQTAGDVVIFQHALHDIPAFPYYVEVIFER